MKCKSPRDCAKTNNHCAHFIQLTNACCHCGQLHKDFHAYWANVSAKQAEVKPE